MHIIPFSASLFDGSRTERPLTSTGCHWPPQVREHSHVPPQCSVHTLVQTCLCKRGHWDITLATCPTSSEALHKLSLIRMEPRPGRQPMDGGMLQLVWIEPCNARTKPSVLFMCLPLCIQKELQIDLLGGLSRGMCWDKSSGVGASNDVCHGGIDCTGTATLSFHILYFAFACLCTAHPICYGNHMSQC